MDHRVSLEVSLKTLKDLLKEMGEKVEYAFQVSMVSLNDANVELAESIVSKDRDLNDLEDKVLELGARIIATQQPIAKDMRRIIIAFRIASDLERMGDLSVDVAKVTIRLMDHVRIKPMTDILRMAEIVAVMISESMQSYIGENVNLAYKMAKADDDVDHMYSQILRELNALMLEKPDMISQGILLCFVGRYLERIADHATNIGENVVYLVDSRRPDLNM